MATLVVSLAACAGDAEEQGPLAHTTASVREPNHGTDDGRAAGASNEGSSSEEPGQPAPAPASVTGLPHDGCRSDGACRLVARAGSGSAQNPVFSPDGRSLAYTYFRSGYNAAPADIMVLDIGSPAPRAIVADGAENVNLPGATWNANGLIIFSSDVDSDDRPWVVRGDGSGKRKLPINVNAPAFEPSFSPDGAFESADVDEGPTNIMWVATPH
jgi:hypothetical protein